MSVVFKLLMDLYTMYREWLFSRVMQYIIDFLIGCKSGVFGENSSDGIVVVCKLLMDMSTSLILKFKISSEPAWCCHCSTEIIFSVIDIRLTA